MKRLLVTATVQYPVFGRFGMKCRQRTVVFLYNCTDQEADILLAECNPDTAIVDGDSNSLAFRDLGQKIEEYVNRGHYIAGKCMEISRIRQCEEGEEHVQPAFSMEGMR